MTTRKQPLYRDYPCEGCDKLATCEDGKKVITSVVNQKVEVGCAKFIHWVGKANRGK